EAFAAGELRFVDAADPASGVAVVAFGGEDLGEEGLVGQALLGGGLGDAGVLVADGRQPEDLGGGGDRGLGGGFAQRGHGRAGPGSGAGAGAGGHASSPVRSWS